MRVFLVCSCALTGKCEKAAKVRPCEAKAENLYLLYLHAAEWTLFPSSLSHFELSPLQIEVGGGG